MKRFILLSIVSLLMVVGTAIAQNPTETLRYSQLRPGGTARALGAGGAFGAVGADYTSVGINPGGLGLYRRSDLSLSFGVQSTNANTNLFGSSADANRVRAYLPNASIVLSRLRKKTSNWKAFNFGFGINRLANYNANSVFVNKQSPNSLLNQYRDELSASGLTEDQISFDNSSPGAVLGYYNYLLNPVGTSGTAYSAITDGYTVNQQISLTRRGGLDEMSFAFGTNYNDRLYLGMVVGIPFLTYREKLNVRESDDANVIPSFNNYSFSQNLTTDGIGVNAKFGLIVRAANWARFGASFHTPTRYSITEKFSTVSTSNVDAVQYSNTSPEGKFDYQLSAPWRAIGSAAFIIKKYGFLSADYEYTNYNRARYTFSGFKSAESALNQDVKDYLRAIHTVRAGGEIAINNFRVRAGYSFSTSPIEKNRVIASRDLISSTYSGGVGYRGKKWYIDMAYYHSASEGTAIISSDITAGEKLKLNNVVMTVGLNF
jgi:hypothetical protein